MSGEFLLIGKIAGVHGIRGSVKVISYGEASDIFESGRSFLLMDVQGGTHTHAIDWVRPHKRGLIIAFQEIRSREAAEALRHADIYMKRSDLPVLEEDTYYWFQLVGLSVINSDGGCLGRISSIMTTGSNDVYVVKDEARGADYEVLVPALASVVLSVDPAAGVMTVDLPSGL